MNVRLTFTNGLSVDRGADVIVLREDLVPSFANSAATWKVIRNCGSKSGHPFFHANDCEIAPSGDWSGQAPRGSAMTSHGLAASPTVRPARSWKVKS